MKVVIYSGIPGAGKSRHIVHTYLSPESPPVQIYSTDIFYMINGRYRYDSTREGDAHAWNMRRFIEAARNPHILHPDTVLVVDNTNTTLAELMPYVAVARAYDHYITVRTILCDPEVAIRRNVHDVPPDVIRRLAEQLNQRKLPSWMSVDRDDLHSADL